MRRVDFLAILTLRLASAYSPGGRAPRIAPPRELVRDVAGAVAGASIAAAVCVSAPPAALGADGAAATSQGFEEFAAQGGTMKAEPSCFFNECGAQSKACFSNPACLKGITCLGNCRGEQLCATQCFARFGSEKLNSWLACTLEEKECVTTGVKQDTSKFYENPPAAVKGFKPSDLEGKWYKVLGYNPKYDTYPCQINTFSARADGGLDNDILFRVPKPGGGGGAWQNNFVESMADSRGPQGAASMTVEGKMFGLTFHEQWYVIGGLDSKPAAKADADAGASGGGGGPEYRVVAYRGDTQQGPYDGAFVYTRAPNALAGDAGAALRAAIDGDVRRAGLDPAQMAAIDNACPADATRAGASAEEGAKEKLEWKDVFELTEWFRPGTLKKQDSFDPTKM